VVAAVVVLPDAADLPYRDSKTVLARGARAPRAHVRAVAVAWAVGEADAAEVDEVGPLRATHLAAHRAIAPSASPDAYVTDFLRLPSSGAPCRSSRRPRADATSLSVAAASLLAKTHRDARMRAAAVDWP
jgi:ribonuclease HII